MIPLRFVVVVAGVSSSAAAFAQEATPKPAEQPIAWELGGFFAASANFDTNNQADQIWLKRSSADIGDERLFFDPTGTRISITGSRSGAAAKAKGQFEFDFKGNGTNLFFPRIRHAYGQIDVKNVSVIIGQTWTLVGMHGPTTYNWDWLFFQGNVYNRVPQLRASPKVGDLQIHFGLFQNGPANGSTTVLVDAANQGTAALGDNADPILQARLQYPVLGKGFVAVAGAFGNTQVYFTPNAGSPVAAFDSGVPVRLGTLDFSLPVDRFTVSGKAWFSSSGGYNSGIGQIAVIDAAGEVHPLSSFGGFLDLKVGLPYSLQASLYAGLDDPEDDIEGVPVRLSKNTTVGGTLSAEVVEKTLLGIETQWVQTEVNGGAATTTFENMRYSIVLQYKL